MREIEIILSKKQWEELRALRSSLDYPDWMKSEEDKIETYEEYLEYRKKHPLKALIG